MILKDLIDSIEHVAPREWQEAWDNSGLQVGFSDTDIRAVLLTVDITEPVLQEALDKGCNLVVSHHPLLFHGLKHITGSTPQERCVLFALQHGIALYSAHTNMDSYLHGVSGRMAEKIGLSDYNILVGDEHGLGVIGSLPDPVPFTDLLARIKQVFRANYLRYIAPPRAYVQRLALCGGAGAEFVNEAIAQRADVYISADWKYHELQAAQGLIGAVDLDHWVSEQFTREVFQELLDGKVKTYISAADKSPIQIA